MNKTIAAQDVQLRPVSPDDETFLLSLYGSTRAEEMALVPWPQEQQQLFVAMQFRAQQDHYQKKYPLAKHEIIVFKGTAVGRLYVARLEKEIRIVDILLLPAERNGGVGSHLLALLLAEAKRRKKPVRIFVESNNPSLRLFSRFGLEPIEQRGIHLLLQFSPNVSNVPPKSLETL